MSETTVWTLDQADLLVCEECECTLQVTAVWESAEVRARPAAGASCRLAA